MGYILTKGEALHVATAKARLIYHFELPRRLPALHLEPINCTRGSTQSICISLHSIIDTYRETRMRISKYLRQQVDRIYDILIELPASSRVQRRGTVWTELWSSFTGLAKETDLEHLRRMLVRIEQGIQRSSQIWKSGTSHFLAAFKVQQSRMDNIKELIHMQRDSTLRLQNQLITLFSRTQNRIALWNDMIKMAFKYSMQLSEIDQLISSIEMLRAGRLSQHLVNHTTLAQSIVSLERFIQYYHPDLKVVRTDIQFYYRRPILKAFRYLRFLIIILEAPVTKIELVKPLHLYHLRKVPLLAPNSVEHYTELGTDILAIIYDRDVESYVVITDDHDVPRDEILDLTVSHLLLRSRAVNSCALALLRGRLQGIKEQCQYHIVNARIPKEVVKLDGNNYLLSNISSVVLNCSEANMSRSFVPDQVQVVLQIHCGCSIWADGFFIVPTTLYCPESRNNLSVSFKPQYLLNLPFISEFTDPDTMKVLERVNYLNKSIPVSFPQLLIASKEYDAKLAIEEESRFHLEEIINQTKNDEKSFNSLSNFIYNEVLKAQTENRDFNVFNMFDWAIVFAILFGLLGLALAVRLHFKVRTLYVLLAASGRAHAEDIPTKIFFKGNLASTEPMGTGIKYHEAVQNVLPVDISILIFLIVFILAVFAYFLTKIWKKQTQGHTSLSLEVGTETNSVSWSVMELNFNPNFYKIEVDQARLNVRLIEGYFKHQLIWGDGVTITNTCLSMRIQLEPKITVRPWELSKTRLILSGQYYTVLKVSCKEALVDVIVLNTCRGGPAIEVAGCPKYHA